MLQFFIIDFFNITFNLNVILKVKMLSCFRRLFCLKSLIKFLTFEVDFKFFHNMTKNKYNIKQKNNETNQ